MSHRAPLCLAIGLVALTTAAFAQSVEMKDGLVQPRGPAGDQSVVVSGQLKQWHKVTLTYSGPFAHELDQKPNPFTDIQINVVFEHESGSPRYVVPMYFAADGNAAETGAQEGTQWRAHVSPDKPGVWNYQINMLPGVGINATEADIRNSSPAIGKIGSIAVAPTDKTGRDFRAKGRLEYVGERYLKFSGSGEYFLKAGPDAPETLLAYADFDGTEPGRKRQARSGEAAPDELLHHYQPHVKDWREGDPTWRGGKGKGLIGALNYLASKGCNTISFLPYNAGGDGDNVWPFVSREDKLHYDCSKLDQWQIVFDHANALGLHLHFKLQENEMDDDRLGSNPPPNGIPESLDGGRLGIERKLYCRELVARFGYELGLLWNIGEENTQSPAEQREMIDYLSKIDPYRHNIVLHTFPDQQEQVYRPLLGDQSMLTGLSLQNGWQHAHRQTLHWIRESESSGRRWVVCNDEQNPASHGVPVDPGYQGHSGKGAQGNNTYDLNDIRKFCLWGTLMAGGGGVEYYFGYEQPQNDLVCEDFRSRDQSWDFCRYALDFFREEAIPFWEMICSDELVGNSSHDNLRYCFAKPGEIYLVYLPNGGSCELDLTQTDGEFDLLWFNPRLGGELTTGTTPRVSGGETASLGNPPSDPDQDWLVVCRRKAPR